MKDEDPSAPGVTCRMLLCFTCYFGLSEPVVIVFATFTSTLRYIVSSASTQPEQIRANQTKMN